MFIVCVGLASGIERGVGRVLHGVDVILTDDRAFLALLAGALPPVSALVPTVAIVALAEGGKMSLAEAREALG